MTDRSRNQAETRRKVSSALACVFAVWRTGLPRPVLVLQGGNALNYFGTGLILPLEIIYLHAVRGFSTATAGLVLATIMGTAAVVTLPSGALLDRFSAKRILIAGNVVNALGYGGLAFVDHPWQGFVCSAVGGAGFGFVGTAGQVLTLTLVPAEQRAASTALRRVAGNFGLGLGATVAGFIVAAAHHQPPGLPGPLPLRRSHVRRLRAGCARLDPGSGTRGCSVGERGRTGFPSCSSGSALARPDRGQPRACDDRRRLLLLHPPAVCAGAYTCRAGRDRCRRLHQHLLHRRSAGAGDTGCDTDAPQSRSVRHQRRIRSRPARGPARNAHALDVRRYHRLGRGGDRDRGRRVWPVHRARPASRGNRTAASARPLHVALPTQLHGRRGPRPRGRRRAARNLTRHHLVGRRPGAGTDRSRLPATRKPDTRRPHTGETPAAPGRVRGHLMRRGTAGAGIL